MSLTNSKSEPTSVVGQATTMIGAKTRNSPDTFYHFSNIRVPKKFLKDVKLGRTFTTIDAYWIIEQLTRHFGLMGSGWGVRDVEYFPHGEKNVECRASLWYIDPATGNYGQIDDVAGDAQVIGGNVAEAHKKAYTNFISKAASYLGLGLHVYLGITADDPYLDRSELSDPTSSTAIDKTIRTSVNNESDRQSAFIHRGVTELGSVLVPAFKQKDGKTFWKAERGWDLRKYQSAKSNDPRKRYPYNLIQDLDFCGHKFGGQFCYDAMRFIESNSTLEQLGEALEAIAKHHDLEAFSGELRKAQPKPEPVSWEEDEIPW